MNLEQLDSIDTTNPEQVKKLQMWLQTRGMIPQGKGEIDGVWGGRTTAGFQQARKELVDAQSTRRDIVEAEGKKNDPMNRLMNLLVDVGPYAGGAGTGAYLGHRRAKTFSKQDEADRSAAKRLSSNPAIKPSAAKAQLDSMRGTRNWRTGTQFLGPGAAFGTAEFLRNYVAPRFDPETQKWINLGANADTGLGAGLLVHQLLNLPERVGSPIDPEDSALINSRTEGQSSKPATESATPKPGTKAALLAEAKARELPVTSRMKKSEIEQQLAKALKANKGKRMTGSRTLKTLGPAGAAITAYDAVMSDAEAADGTVTAGDRLKGAVAGTAAGGSVYGMERLMNVLKGKAPNLVRSLGGGMVAMLPDAIGSQFDDYTPDELTAGSNQLYNQQARFQEATGLPDWLMGQNVAEAREMATVPEPNLARVYENAYQPGGQPSGYGGTHTMPDGSTMANSEMQEPPAQPQPEQQPPADDAEFQALSQAFEQDPEIADLLREYIKSRIDPAQYQ